MPVNVAVELQTISGDPHAFRLGQAATCADLRRVAHQRLNVPRTRIIICKGNDILDDAAALVDLVE